MNWKIKIANAALKNLKRFPAKDGEKIKSVLNELIFNPYAGDIEKMEGEENSWRRRVGSYRVFYDVDKKNGVINITYIERRTSATY